MENIADAPSPGSILSRFVRDLPRSLFGLLDSLEGPSLPSHQRVALALEAVRIEESVPAPPPRTGRPAYSRRCLARAFVAKAVLNIPTTRGLAERLRLDARLRRIVGFPGRAPSEATFSRAFAEFARAGLADAAHERAAARHLGEDFLMHAALDASAVPARERAAPKPAPSPRIRSRRGRKPGRVPPEPTRQERQLAREPRAALSDLPAGCSVGAKVGSKGTLETWRGYKAHALVADGGLPLAFWTTGAGLHDSQAAVPLIRMGASRAGFVAYLLADKAYQGEPIRQAVREAGGTLVAPPKAPKGGTAVPLDPASAQRFRARTVVERFFAELKDDRGGRWIFVKGRDKVHAHLMMGVLAIFGLAIFRGT